MCVCLYILVLYIRWKTVITLTDSIITFKQPSNDQLISIPVDKQRLIRILKRQVGPFNYSFIHLSIRQKGSTFYNEFT